MPSDEPREVRELRAAILRAFAGTRWRPAAMKSWVRIGRAFDTVVLELRMDHLYGDYVQHGGTIPMDEFLPGSARARDPRVHLRRRREGRARQRRARRRDRMMLRSR